MEIDADDNGLRCNAPKTNVTSKIVYILGESESRIGPDRDYCNFVCK